MENNISDKTAQSSLKCLNINKKIRFFYQHFFNDKFYINLKKNTIKYYYCKTINYSNFCLTYCSHDVSYNTSCGFSNHITYSAKQHLDHDVPINRTVCQLQDLTPI